MAAILSEGVILKTLKNLLKRVMSVLLIPLLVIGGLPLEINNVFAAEGDDVPPTVIPEDAPKHGKELVDNGDGTYTLSLSVTGKASSSMTQEVTKSNVILLIDTSSSMTTGATGYNGSRLAAEKNTLTKTDGIIDKLLANNGNTTATADIIELYGINFGTGGTRAWDWSTNGTTIKSAINNLSTNRGTNWEEALSLAKAAADAKHAAEPDDNTYIILLTDGQPTTDQTRPETGNNNRHSVNTNYSEEWGYASDDARAIVNAGYTLYGIYTFGPTNISSNTTCDTPDSGGSICLKSLVNYAYTGTGTANSPLSSDYAQYFYDATDTQALIDALETIVNEISSTVGYTNIAVTDGLTDLTSSMNVDGKISNLTYTRSGGDYGSGTVWTDAPAAITTNGTVNWNLGKMVLEDGVTYTVSFVVWPSQESYDLVADLNNGKKTYDSLSASQKASIINTNGVYTLKTNTDYPTLTYSTVTTTTSNAGTETVVSTPTTFSIKNPDPVGLKNQKLTLEKKWEDTLDPSQREEVNGEVTLDFYRDGQPYEQSITLTEESEWKLKDYISIAPGILISNDSANYDLLKQGHTEYSFNGKKYIILETGHDYYFQEEDINDHFELTNYIYHPMLVDNVMKNVFFTRDSSGNITGIKEFKNMDTVSATNTLKGGILVGKKVINNDKEDTTITDEYEITITMTGSDTGQYRIYTYNADGTVASRTDKKDYPGGKITEKIKVNQKIMVTDVPTGTKFNVTEILPSGYTSNKVDYEVIMYDGTDNKEGVNEVFGNASSTATVTNYLESGDLIISKKVTASSGNLTEAQKKLFGFTVYFYGPDDSETPVRVDDSTCNKKGDVDNRIAHNGTCTINDIPTGWTYKIVEDAAAGFNEGKTTTKTGTIKKGDNKEEFTNNYAVAPLDPTSAKIVANKAFARGYEQFWISSDQFTFVMTGNGETQTSKPLTLDSKVAEFIATIKDEGTYTYTITEKTADSEGNSLFRTGVSRLENDEDIVVTLVVKDNGDGILKLVSKTYSKASQTIYNKYEGDNTYGGKTGELEFTKNLTGRDWQSSDKFDFTISSQDEGAPMPATTTITADKDHKTVGFGKIKFTNKDVGKTYTYTVTEDFDVPSVEATGTSAGGISLTITVSYNTTTGKIDLAVSNYETTFTNEYKKVSVTAKKVWDDGNNRDDLRKNYDGFYVAVKNDEGKYVAYEKLALVDKDDYEFSNLPEKNAEGETIKYTIVEASTCSGTGELIRCTEFKEDGNYTATVKDGVITNTHKPATTIFTIKKIWNISAGTLPDLAPKLVDVEVSNDKNKNVETVTLSGDDYATWEGTFEGYAYEAGEPITYTVTEKTIGGSLVSSTTKTLYVYEKEILKGKWVASHNGPEVTNTWTPVNDKVEYDGDSKFTIKKVDEDGEKMSGVTFTINGNDSQTNGDGKIEVAVPISKEEKTDNLSFEVEEKETLEGYDLVDEPATVTVTCTSELSDMDETTLTNTYTKTCAFAKSGSEDYKWNVTDKVLVVANNRSLAASLVIRKKISGVTAEALKNNGLKFILTGPSDFETKEISFSEFTKVSDGVYEYTVSGRVPTGSYKVVESGAEFDGLLTLTVSGDNDEAKVVAKDDEAEFAIKNSYEKIRDVSYSVAKTWLDDDNRDGIRPDELEVTLLRDGVAYGEPVKLKNGSWEYTWSNLPRAGENAVLYEYSAVEEDVDDYDSNNGIFFDGVLTFTNAHNPELINEEDDDPDNDGKLVITKTWNDGNNELKTRPDSIVVYLYANEDKIDSATIMPNEYDEWMHTFSGLYKYAGGEEIKYSIKEAYVDGYRAEISDESIAEGFTIENTSTNPCAFGGCGSVVVVKYETTKILAPETGKNTVETSDDGASVNMVVVAMIATATIITVAGAAVFAKRK